MKLSRSLLALLATLAVGLPALAQDDPADASPAAPPDAMAEFLDLASAYQSGYFQVVAVSCFQLYSSAGIIATDFENGYIDSAVALEAVTQASLLHSVCTTTLITIGELTPPEDTVAHAEIEGLLAVLSAEGLLISTLTDLFGELTAENAAAVAAAKQIVDQEMERYIAADAPAPES